mgnify:CR=1 FL=1|tara:strand:- start:4007 stop:4831 length:825 start_codon:yes stop_codon:yes gene_type:complete
MCGGGGDQTVTQKTELDPAMRRLLYGGTAANPRGGFGSTAAAANSGGGQGGGQGGGNQYNNSDSDSTAAALRLHYESHPGTAPGSPLDATGIGSPDYGSQPAPTYSDLGSPNNPNVMEAPTNPGSSFSGNQGLYAMGGPVMPQQGLASLNQGQMPMMNGQMPNLSDPMTAATLAMAVRSPQMRYGSIMAQPNPMMAQPMMAQPMQGYAMGGYIEGPGTGTSDSIPARIYQGGVPVQEAALSDGEFVMTKDAVDGAGGAAAMYAHMRKFENGGTA